MFFFERDVSRKLIAVSRKHLPDHTKVPALQIFLQDGQSLLQSVVMATVKRGDFSIAVRHLTDLLMRIAADHRFEFSEISSSQTRFGIDSLVVVAVALLAAFTQQMIDDKSLPESAVHRLEPHFYPACSLYAWHSVSRVPPLDRSVATDLLTLAIRVIPRSFMSASPLSPTAMDPRKKLADLLMSMMDYIYMSNPAVVQEYMGSALAEWDYPAMVELTVLSPVDSGALEDYLTLIKSYMPRLDSNEQQKLLSMTCRAMLRGMVARPACHWASGPAANAAIRSFGTFIEKSRIFRALRVFKRDEALAITLMEILQKAGTMHHATSPSQSASTSASPQKQVSSLLRKGLSSLDSNGGSVSPNTSPSLLADPDMHHYSKVELISVAHTRTFERALSLARRENPRDKRAASRLGAIEYFVFLAYFGWVVAERPDGEPFSGISLDIAPIIPLISEDFQNVSKEIQVRFAAVCSQQYPSEFDKLVRKMEPRLIFDTLELVRITAQPSHFARVLRINSRFFSKFIFAALSNEEMYTVFAGLNTLLSVEREELQVLLLLDVLRQLTQFMAQSDLDSIISNLLETYVMQLVNKIDPKELDVSVLTPLILTGSPVDIFRTPKKLQSFYHFLRILARDHVLVPVSHLEGDGILADKVQHMREVLLVSLCSDSRSTIETALKCLELLQSDSKQSRAERDLVSELLDSMDQSLPSTKDMQRRMAALIAGDPDVSFTRFNEVVRQTLDVIKDEPVSDRIHGNLLRVRTATLILEPPEVRESFYRDLLPLNGKLLRAVTGSVSLRFKLAGEFLRATIRLNETPERYESQSRDGTQLAGKCQLYAWLLECLEVDQLISATELCLGDICARAVSSLKKDADLSQEVAVLKLLETSALYAARADKEESSSGLFSKAIHLAFDREWSVEAHGPLESALSTLLRFYVEPDEIAIGNLVQRISKLGTDGIRVSLLTALLSANFRDVVKYCEEFKELGGIYRASVYEALTERYPSKIPDMENTEKTGDLVVFLLGNKPVITALSDVCSLNGDDGLSSALFQLFSSHSKGSERKLIRVAVAHEVSSANSAADIFRGNSVTMKVLLEWLRSVSSSYLRDLLSPALGSLRSASIRDEADMEMLFVDAAARFKHRTIPAEMRWLISLVMEHAVPLYGEEASKHSLAILLILRFVCPAVVAPHSFGVSRRPPARQFANILRKFAIYLQRHGDLIYDYMSCFDPSKIACSGSSPLLASCGVCSEDCESLLVEMDKSSTAKYGDVNEQYTSASRRVYHFLRRHAVEVRVVLLSRGNGEVVAKMLRFFRLGRLSGPANKSNQPAQEKKRGLFRGEQVIAISARSLYPKHGAVSKDMVKDFGSRDTPTLIDFTDFTGLFDFWAEFMLYMAYSMMKDTDNEYKFYAVNCPRRAKAVIARLEHLILQPAMIVFSTSLDFVSSPEAIPENLVDVRSAIADIKDAVKFSVQVRPGANASPYEADLYIGSKYLQILGKDQECDVIPYVSHVENEQPLEIKLNPNELLISLGGSDFTIYRPSSSLIRVLGLSIAASGAKEFGATVEIQQAASLVSPQKPPWLPAENVASDRSDIVSLDGSRRGLSDNSATAASFKIGLDDHCASVFKNLKAPKCSMDVHDGSLCPGKLLFSALLDSLHESPEVRRRAIDIYTLLPDYFGLQINVLSPQQMLLPNQVFTLAAVAAKRHPELAICVVTALAHEGTSINERAAKIAAPWVPYLDYELVSHRNLLRAVVLEPLLQAVSDAPDTVGPPLLEHFWPFLRGLPTLMADILLKVSTKASAPSLEALRQILASGISSERPHESREFAEALLARLYSNLRGTGNPAATLWSQHPDWSEINVCAILFGSITVDWHVAEELVPDVAFLLLILAGVGTPQLRNALYQLITNYLNAFIQSPRVSSNQRQTLHHLRTELSGPRGLALFGVQTESTELTQVWVSDGFAEHSPEMSEHLGWLVSDIVAAAFADRLAMHQETRVAIASRVMEHTDITWPPLQRRCILGLIGSVRFLMPEAIVADLLSKMGQSLAETRPGSLETRGELMSSFLRMFSETLECIPDTGVYQQYLFWLAVLALATGCITIQLDAMRLLRESIKIAHFRGMFRERTVSQVYLSVIPPYLCRKNSENLQSSLPLDVPTSEANFHIALAQLLVTPLQKTESQTMALDCCDVLATACPHEFVYPYFLYLGGEESRIAARVPAGVLVDGNEGIAHWLASRVKHDNMSSVLSLALSAEICGFSRSMNFSQSGPRLLDLISTVKDRRVVNTISPLLRRILLKLLELGEESLEAAIAKWSTSIFSHSPEERREIDGRRELGALVDSIGLRPWFDDNCQIHPMFFEDEFSESTRFALEERRWIVQTTSSNPLSVQAEKLF